MKIKKFNAQGFTHYVALFAMLTVAIVVGVFVVVLKANHKSSTQSNLTTASGNARSKSKLSSNEKLQSGLSTTDSTSNSALTTPASIPPKTSTSTPAKSSTTTSQSTSNSAPAPAPTPAAPPAQTPLSVLTTLITNLDNGAQVNVTATPVTVPGPISNAQARPIVFTANGQTYFAYHQGSAANFNESASQTAGSMAIVNATVNNPSLVQAHLDKAGNLVDPNISGTLVGYSQSSN